MLKPARTPDLSAPRYRRRALDPLKRPFFDRLRENVEAARTLSDEEIRRIIGIFNGNLWQQVIEHRDGASLPEQLGSLFIGSCPPARTNVDFQKIPLYGKAVTRRNWDTDGQVAKVFYTSYEHRYGFRNQDIWGFRAVRQFKRGVSRSFRENWQMYIRIDHDLYISRLYRRQMYKLKKQEQAALAPQPPD